MNKRIFVRKKSDFEVESKALEQELKQSLHLKDDFSLTKYNIYDIFNADENDIDLLKANVCSEVVTDEVLEDVDLKDKKYLAYEYLPGQYDQRADSAEQCLMLLNNKKTVRLHSGTLLVFENAEDPDVEKIADYLINPVESRAKDLSVLDDDQDVKIEDVPVIEGFIDMSEEDLKNLVDS